MKQDAANHWKVQALGKSLAKRISEQSLGGAGLSPELGRRLAMGVVESLWIWCKRYYPRGDIGRASDEQIAIEVGWDEKDSAFLIAEFCRIRLIDAHPKHRYVVHDLSEHAEDHVRKSLERAGIKTFADGKPVRREGVGRPPKETTPKLAGNSPPSNKRLTEIPPALPNPIPPNPAQSSPTHPNPIPAATFDTNAGFTPVPIGSGGIGKGTGKEAPPRWNPVSLRNFLLACGVNVKTAAELAPHAAKFDGVDLALEWNRIRSDPTRKDKSATLVCWLEKAAKIDRSSVGTIASGLRVVGGGE